MATKQNKYFSITETIRITGLNASKLRYIEKSNPLFKVKQVRNRRYYDQENIDYLMKHYSKTNVLVEEKPQENKSIDIIDKIDIILGKFRELIAVNR